MSDECGVNDCGSKSEDGSVRITMILFLLRSQWKSKPQRNCGELTLHASKAVLQIETFGRESVSKTSMFNRLDTFKFSK